MSGAAFAAATGGVITAGSGQITQTGSTTNIRQNSQTLALNWQSFNVAPNETVNFMQPGANSIAINRILSSSPSEIFGHLDANGQVWLINPNGILFGQGAQVNVGGLVASTLDFDNSTLGSSDRNFSGGGKGSVINQGAITAANGGYAALIGNRVSNQGVISAQLGTVALAGGSAATLTFRGNQLLHVQVSQSTLNNLAENKQLIVANGGQVLMTAGAKDAVMASLVNNTGVIQAQSVENHNGTITLLGGMNAGTVDVGGTLDASAPNGGNGGSIETSAAHFNLASNAQITASAPRGSAGTWLIDPTDLTIDAPAATTISTTLNAGTNVTEQTTATGASGIGTQTPGLGDINVNSAVSWTNPAATLTLSAFHAINVNAPVNGAGAVVMDATGGNLTIAAGASVTGGTGLASGTGVTLGAAGNFVNNAGGAAVSTGGAAHWLVYSTNPTLDTAGGLTPGFIQYNAPYATAPDLAAANGFLYSLAPTLNVTGLTGGVTKVYDGTTTAPLTGLNLTTTGLVNGNLISTATGTYASSNAATGLSVTSPGTISAFNITDSTGSIPVFGYALSGTASSKVGSITPAPLTAAIVGDPTNTYDGTVTATLISANYGLSGFVAGQGATVNQPATLAWASADAGPETLNATFVPTNFVANPGTNLANYILPTAATGLGTILQAQLQITGLSASNKVYDATTADPINAGSAALFGVVSTDAGAVTLDTTGAAGNFASPNVGNNLPVTFSGFTLTGARASNYVLVEPSGFTANITPLALTLSGVLAANKVYNATTADTLNVSGATLSGVIPSDASKLSLSSAGATGTFSTSNVGSGLAVTAAGFSLTGASAGNYTISQPSGLTADITPAPLTISMTGDPTKAYDSTTFANLDSSNFLVGGFVGGQNGTVGQNAVASYASPNAAADVAVTATIHASDFSLTPGTLLSNYSFPASVTGMGTITPLLLTASIVNNPTKTYDGTTAASLTSSNYSLTGFFAGQGASITETAGTYGSPNAGVEPVSANVTSADFAPTAGTLLSNYILPTVISGFGTITPLQLTGSVQANITGNPTKIYDGTTVATLTPSDFTLSGFVAGQGATVNQTVGHYASANVGTMPVSATLMPSNFVPTPGTNLGNYTLPTSAFGTGTINPAVLTATVIGNPTLVYNGSNLASPTSANFQITGFVSGQGATINPTALVTYASANAGPELVSANLIPSEYVAENGTLLSNYVLDALAQGPGTITRAPLYVTGVFATNKVYNTNTIDPLITGSAALSGLASVDTGAVTLTTGTTGTFSQANVGNNLAVTANGFSISGSAAANYLLQPIAGLIANITPAPLTIAGVTADSRIYNGTNIAGLTTSGDALNGVLGSDAVTLSSAGASGVFPQSNVGNNLPVTASGFMIGGAAAGNYTLAQPTGLTASITPAPLTVTISGSPTKVYDASTSATLTAADYTITGFAPGQGASIPQSATANYASPNAGTGLAIQSTLETQDYVPTVGTNLSNYILPATSSGDLGVIMPAVLNLTGTRVYDAGTDAAASLFGSGGVLQGIAGQTLTLSGTGVLASKNVNPEQPFAAGGLSGFTLTGNGAALAGNYTFVGGVDWVDITPATLSVVGTTTSNRVYNGTTTDSLAGSALSGLLGADAVTLGNDTTGTFATKNVGNGIAVTTDMTISGADAGNYIITQPTGLTANITPLGITVNATGVNRQYDGTVNDASVLSSTGVIAGDTVNFADTSSTFASPNVGNGLTVTVDGISASGADAGNYTLFNNTALTTANITPRILNLTGTRVYDANTDAAASLFGTGGQLTGVAGQTLTLSGTGVLASKNVNAQQAFATGGLSEFTLTGNGAALASNYTLIGGVDWVNITPAPLAVIGTTPSNRVYNGTTIDALTGATLSGLLGTDAVTLGNDTTGTFASKNVGNGIAVTTAMTISGTDASNYILTQPTGLTANITPLGITVTATGTNKVYNANSNDTVKLASAGVIAGDVVNFADTSALFASPNVGNNLTVTVNGISKSGSGAGNYTLLNTSALTTANITPVILNLTGTRVYDANTDAAASLFGTGGQLAGVAGQTLTLSGTGVLVSKNVNAKQAFATGGLAGFTLAGNGAALATNYTLTGGVDWVNITPAPLTAIGTTTSNRVYNGTTVDALSGATLSGLLGTDAVALGNDTTGTFASKNVGNGIPVTTAMTISGTDAANYIFTQPTGLTANITPLAISVSATGTNKTYDGNNNDAVTLSGAGVIAGDAINFADTSATFADPNAGNNKAVTVDGISASGADSGNYTLTNTTATTTADINPVILNLTGTRVYDGTTDATAILFGAGGQLTGVAGQTLTLSGTGVLASKNVNPQQAFAADGLSGFTLTGNGAALASNYTLVGGVDWVNITPLSIALTATAANKSYDGNANAIATVSSPGLIAGDTVDFSDTSATFASPNAGNGQTVTVNGITASGADASNYSFVNTATTTADITPAIINLTGTRVYDATTDANASLFGTAGQITGVAGQTLTLSGAGVLTSKNVDPAQTFASLGTLALTGNGSALASNYTLIGGTDSVNITPLAISVSAIGTNKVYDGNSDDAVVLSSTGLLPGDSLNFANTAATLASPNVGNNIPVSVDGISANGADAGNYTLINTTASTIANVTPAIINLSGTRVYDATTDADASLFGSNGVLQGVAGQTLTLTGSGLLTSKNVYPAQTFTSLGTLALGDGTGLASNYTLIGGTDLVDITPAMLTVTGTLASDRVYNGTTIDALSGSTLSGLFAGDAVALGNDTIGTFDNKNVGNDKAITTAMTISGADAANYIFVQPTGLTANVTPLAITVDATGTNKIYDGNTLDTIGLSSSGILAGDQVDFSSTSANFSDKNVGNGKTVAVDGISDSGADAGNYVFNTSATTTANITPLMITVDASGINKVYDGNALALVSLNSAGVLPGDQLTFSDISALFNSKDAGNGKLIDVFGITGSGADAGNYVFNTMATTTANITPLPLSVIADALSRAYNGSDGDSVTLSSNGVLPGDQVTFVDSSANFQTPFAGNDKPVIVTGISAVGANAGNYTVLDPQLITFANITGDSPLAIGVPGSSLAQIQSLLGPRPIATPYGTTDMGAVGVYTGNQQLRHRPIERNRIRTDFHAGMGLKVIDGGVRLPANASP